jgi:hypothetical protein
MTRGGSLWKRLFFFLTSNFLFFQFNLNKSRQFLYRLIKTCLNRKFRYCPNEKAQNYNAED